jgi:3-hydroxybutyryl-CoA dehydrogenase
MTVTSSDNLRIGILGAGLMGHGIAQAFAIKGFQVAIFDTDPNTLATVHQRVRTNLDTYLKLKKITPVEIDQCVRNITLCKEVDLLCKEVDIIIEAVKENFDVKQDLFQELESKISDQVIVASNTSAFSITRLSEIFSHRQRFLGTHFWNPPHIIPCVEVIRGKHTSDEVFETVFSLMEDIGKKPVKVLKDVPGFLGNRLQHAMWREAISLAEKGIASPEDIDRVVKYGFGLRLPFLGPLETADLAGLDLSLDIHAYLFPYLENASQPSLKLKTLVDNGCLGAKAGKGFYEWPEEKKTAVIGNRDTVLLNILKELAPG